MRLHDFMHRHTLSSMDFIEVGGALSEEIKPKYHKIPAIALKRLAQRFAVGEQYDDPAECAKINGAMNWEGGNEVFWIERYNHAIEHLLLYAEGDTTDDHLAAVMWYCAARMKAENKTGR